MLVLILMPGMMINAAASRWVASAIGVSAAAT
jgi:hypothetical protein